MSREYRQVRPGFLEVRAAQDGTSGRIVADVMKYNVIDDYRTAFEPRCFSESLETRMPRILWSHNAHDPIGQWIDAEDTPDRLRLAGALDLAMIDGTMTPAVPSAHRAFAQLRSRTIDQFSVGFVRQGEARNKLRQGVTSITKAQLDEASPILLGSVPGAELVSVRSANPDMQLFGRQRRLTFFPRETRSAALDAEREERVAGGQFAKGGGRVPGSAKAGSGPVVPSLPGFPKRGHMDTKRLEAAAERVDAKKAAQVVKQSGTYHVGGGSNPSRIVHKAEPDPGDPTVVLTHTTTYKPGTSQVITAAVPTRMTPSEHASYLKRTGAVKVSG